MARAMRLRRAFPKWRIDIPSPFAYAYRAYGKLMPNRSGRNEGQIIDKESWFALNRSRYVQNEAYEMATRCVRFDMEELKKVAAAAVHSKSCVQVEMYAESMHSKTFLLTMDDGKEAVAKLPFPIVGRSHFTTASEVATMDLMRNHLDIPVPKVHAWCSRAESTPVGAEYIIMAKAVGVPLESVWKTLKLGQRVEIMKEFARFQTNWASATFEGYGSIYYASDLTPENSLPLKHLARQQSKAQAFALGPITGGDCWNKEGRLLVDFDRGPWSTVYDYMKAIGHREAACIEKLPKLPPTRLLLCGPGTYESTRAKKLRAVEYYLQLLKHLIPSDPILQKPSAWHNDLHGANIFVDPSDHTKITEIIDWCSTEVAPLFMQARQPGFLNHEGPQAEGLDRPKLPENFKELPPEAQKAANSLLLDQCLPVAYRIWTQGVNPDVFKCLQLRETSTQTLLETAGTLLREGEAAFTQQIFEFLKSNPEILNETGISLSESLVAEVEADAEGTGLALQTMERIECAMGELFPSYGFVRADQYEEAKYALGQIKEEVIKEFARTEADRAAWEESWPFDD